MCRAKRGTFILRFLCCSGFKIGLFCGHFFLKTDFMKEFMNGHETFSYILTFDENTTSTTF